MTNEVSPPPPSVWAVVGNIIGERPAGPGGTEVRAGTRLFRPNAKVYLCGLRHFWAVLKPSKSQQIIVLG